MKLRNEIWVEKYRPQNFNNIIGQDISKVEKFCSKPQSLPHFLFYGKAGTGKTTTGKVLIRTLEADCLVINASDNNSVDDIREKVKTFVMSMTTKKGIPRIVLLDEADYLSKNAQGSLRALMEEYHSNAKFILTCNYLKKIIDPIQSRCVKIEFKEIPKDKLFNRLKVICEKENVDYDEESLNKIIDTFYPDIRKCINKIQELSIVNNSIKGIKKVKETVNTIYTLVRELKFKEARELWIKNAVDPFSLTVDLFNKFYDEIENRLPANITKKILIELADTNYKLQIGGNPEIQLAGGVLRVINHLGEYGNR